jgi:hypothetical protein
MAVRELIRRRVPRPAATVRRIASPGVMAARGKARERIQGAGGLMIGGVRDPAERAADRLADRVMRMPEPAGVVRRMCAECATEDLREAHRQTPDQDAETLRMRAAATPIAPGATSAPAPAAARAAIGAMGAARPLSRSERVFFEPRFGADFSGVRVHDDAAAARAARALDARAFTLGRDIAFAPGERAPGTSAGDRLTAHELAHVVVRQNSSGTRDGIQRKVATSTYKDCAETKISNADLKVENGRHTAINYLQVAIRDLKRSPASSTASQSYKAALKTHFINPNDDQRAAIRKNMSSILDFLKDTKNIVCAASQEDLEACQKQSHPVGFVKPKDNLITVCPAFFDESITCRAILLIHEAAHTLGIGAKATHPPYRGAGDYPGPGAATSGTQTTAQRMDNPDAYGYFAANIWRETDTICLPSLPIGEITIEITGTAPKTESK